MDLTQALSRGLSPERLVVDRDVLAALSHDDAEWTPAGQAAVGVRARSEAEVRHAPGRRSRSCSTRRSRSAAQ
jgi:glycolate oxidase